MPYLIAILFLIVYSLGLVVAWEKFVTWRLPLPPSRILKGIHYTALVLCLLIALLFGVFEIGLRGLWTTRILIFITLLTGILIFPLANKQVFNKVEQGYFRIFSFLPILTAGFAVIPFIGFMILFSVAGQLIDPASEIYYEDSQIRVQATFVGALGPPAIDVYEKRGLFEKRIKRADQLASEVADFQVIQELDSTRVILIPKWDNLDGEPASHQLIALPRNN